MRLKFTKMHGLGNDFMVIDGVTQPVEFNAADIERWADRHMGIGFDQLLLVEPRPGRIVTFATGYSTPTAPRLKTAAMAPAALPALSWTAS